MRSLLQELLQTGTWEAVKFKALELRQEFTSRMTSLDYKTNHYDKDLIYLKGCLDGLSKLLSAIEKTKKGA